MRYQQIELPVNLTSIAADYLAQRNKLQVFKPGSQAAMRAAAVKSSLEDVLTHALGLHVQANFGQIVSLVGVLDEFEVPQTHSIEAFREAADDLIDVYIEKARAATVSMAHALAAVEDAFAQVEEDG